jgi:hypothetical protein
MGQTYHWKDRLLNVRRGTTLTALTTHLGLLTSKPDLTVTSGFVGSTEVSYTGYARQSTAFAAPATGSGVTRQTATNASISFGAMTAGAGGWCGYCAEFDASTAGNMLAADPLPDVGAPLTVTAATNASPIAITTSAAHGLASGQFVRVASVGGNTAANGEWIITVTSGTAFTLTGTTGNGAYTSGGTVQPFGFNVQVGVTPQIASGSYLVQQT